MNLYAGVSLNLRSLIKLTYPEQGFNLLIHFLLHQVVKDINI